MDATLTIQHTPGAYSFLWLPQGAGLARAGVDQSIAESCLTGAMTIAPELQHALQQALDAAAQYLNLQSHTTPSMAAAHTPLIHLGQALYQQLVPPQIQAALAHLPEPANLTLVTDDANLPWELLHDDQEFLALRHPIGRILPLTEQPRPTDAPPPARLRCLLLGNPNGDLRLAEEEVDALTALFDQRSDWVHSTCHSGSRVTTANVLQWLASGDYDLIHFAGHASPGLLHLADGTLALPAIRRAIKGRPLVYLNACASARDPTQPQPNLNAAEQSAQGLARAFLGGGAAAVIGMLWPVPDQSNYQLALAFYQTLLRGASIGEALRQSRLNLRSAPDAGVSWLAPVLYGDPRLRPLQAGLIYRPGTVMIVRLPDDANRWQERSFDALSLTLQQQLYTLRNIVASYGGVTVSIHSTALVALFGIYSPVEQDALAALQTACDIRDLMATWSLDAPLIGVASGDLAVEPLGPLAAQTDAPLRQPFLIGAPVTAAFALALNATPGQIRVNDLAARSAQSRYHFVAVDQGKVLVQAVLPTSRLAPAPDETATPAQSAGRERELRRLHEEWDAVQRRQGRVIGVVGEAGIGKTHLLAEFFQRTEATPRRWITLTCLRDTQHTPYGMLALSLRRLFDLPVDADEAQASAVIQSRLAGASGLLQRSAGERTALLLDLLGYAQDGSPGLQADFHKGQQTVYQSRLLAPLQFLIDQIVQQAPLVLAVEDAHWLDVATRNVLTLLTETMRARPILLLLSYRPGWEHGWFGKPYYQHLALGELDGDASRQLVASYLHTRELPADLLELIERTGGNPLFLIETVRSLQERGILQQEPAADQPNGRWVLRQALNLLQLPDTVQRMLQLRFGQLGEETRRVLEIAAVIGLRFSPTLLAQLAQIDEAALLTHLEQLQAREFIRLDWGSEEYTFCHAAIQEAAYAEVGMADRRAWHARTAQALEQAAERDGVTPDILARHYYLSLVREEAVAEKPALLDDLDLRLIQHALTYLLQSGERALTRYALQEAERALRRGKTVAALLQHQPDQQYGLQAQIEAGLGNTYNILGQFPQALHHLRQAYALFHAQPLTAESRRLVADLARRIARLYAWRKEYTTAFAWIEAGWETMQQRNAAADQAVVALLHIHAGSIYYNQGHYAATEEACQQGIRLAEPIQAEAVLAEGYHLLGVVAESRGQYDQALHYYDQCLTRRKALGDVYQIARTEGNIGVVHYDRAEWEEARTHYERARTVWQEIGDRDMLANTSLNLGNIALCFGDWARAEQYYQEALTLWSELEIQRWIALAHNNLGLLAIERAEWVEARSRLTPNLDSPFQDIGVEAHYALAKVALGQQRVDEALVLAGKAVRLAEALHSQRELGLALRAEGRALVAAGDFVAGRQRLERSRNLLLETGGRYEAARTTYRLAELEAIAGNFERAATECASALAVFQALHAQKDEARAFDLQQNVRSLSPGATN